MLASTSTLAYVSGFCCPVTIFYEYDYYELRYLSVLHNFDYLYLGEITGRLFMDFLTQSRVLKTCDLCILIYLIYLGKIAPL